MGQDFKVTREAVQLALLKVDTDGDRHGGRGRDAGRGRGGWVSISCRLTTTDGTVQPALVGVAWLGGGEITG